MINQQEILNARILIVDDQEYNVMLLEQILSEAGYTNYTATRDSTQVCELHSKHRYDLILLDLQMPGMDGFQVMEGLNKLKQDDYLPVLVISAHYEQKLRALALGAKDFIKKPFDFLEIKVRIHNMLEVRLLYQQLAETNRALEFMSLHDILTGLPNRRLLMDRLASALARAKRNTGRMALLYLDLDGFKQINDRLGHDAGDTLLRLVAARLAATVRQADTVARLGGDEFVIVLSEIGHLNAVEKLLSKLLETVSQPYLIDEQQVTITASIGVSLYPLHGADKDALMKHADAAMYVAKNAGKNYYSIATASDLSSVTVLR